MPRQGHGYQHDDYSQTWNNDDGRPDASQFTDKPIECQDCKGEFVWTAKDQAFYQSKGFTSPPKRCKPCRDVRKAQGGQQPRR